MALPTLAETKSYLRVETTAEDSVITDLLASATAWAEVLIGRPITAVEKTLQAVPSYDEYGRHYFFLPVWPVDVSDENAAVVTDANGNVVVADNYTVDSRTGRFQTIVGKTFTSSPFSIVATVGLSADPDYATKYEPRVRSLIMGLTAILYKQRNPNASSDSSAGVSVSYAQTALPPYLDQIAKQLRGSRIR